MKPDVTAPGVDILSSLPRNQWSDHDWSGTSMASPHVAGAAALLKQRHPTWTVAQIKSALESTGDPVHPAGSTAEVSALREGGGRIDLARADNPLVFTDPTGLSFGLVKRGATSDAARSRSPTPAAALPRGPRRSRRRRRRPASTLSLAAPLAAAGTHAQRHAHRRRRRGRRRRDRLRRLTRGTDVRRVPYWLHVEVPQLGTRAARDAPAPGHLRRQHGRQALARLELPLSRRRPRVQLQDRRAARPLGPGAGLPLHGEEAASRTSAPSCSRTRAGVRVSPRLVVAGDENRLVGFTALPVNINPYQHYGAVEPVVGAIAPLPGAYDFVFDTPAGAQAGQVHVPGLGERRRPRRPSHLLTRTVRAGSRSASRSPTPARASIPRSIVAEASTASRPRFAFKRGVLSVPTAGSRAGTHRLRLVVSDYQEAKNMENVGPILPNTRRSSRDRRRPLARGTRPRSSAGSRGRARRSRRSRPRRVGCTTRSEAFRFARSRRRRASAPTRVSSPAPSRGHSAPTTTATASASRAMYSQLTGPILPKRGVNRSGLPADREA